MTSIQGDRLLLNIGSGPRSAFRHGPGQGPALPTGWRELRVDIDPACRPDIVASATELREHLPEASADVVFSSHVLEHFFDHEADAALAEMRRVLKPGGIVVVICPDLEAVLRAFDPDDPGKTLYQAPAGPISALDMLFGHRASIAAGQTHMAHRFGYTEQSLGRRLLAAGFAEARIHRSPAFDLCAIAADTPPGPALDILHPMTGIEKNVFGYET